MTTMNGWPQVAIGELLKPNEQIATLSPTEHYREVTVRLWGRGVVLRREVTGAEISGRRFKVSADQFIMSRIDARNGAMGVVPLELDGAVVTNDFPTFNTDHSRLLPAFLGWLSKTPDFVDACRSVSEGTTNRVRLKEGKFLKVPIPLPPLEEQQRIVSRIDRLAAKVDEARGLVQQTETQTDLLAVIMAHRTDLPVAEKIAAGWKEVHLSEVIKASFDDQPVAGTEQYPNFGIYSYGRGLFPKAPIDGLNTSATRLRRVHAGQFIYSRLFAWEGAFGLVTPEYDGWYVSGEYPTFNCDSEKILPEFLFAYFKAKHAWMTVALGSKGLGSRRQRVQPDQILGHKLLLPPMDIQTKIKRVFARYPDIQDQHSSSSKQIEALLPSILDRAFRGEL